MKRNEVIKSINETYSVDAEYLWDGETHAVMNVKADPILIEDLLHEEAFLPA